jgi:hypothetical protein
MKFEYREYRARRPHRDQLWGMSPSQFKTFLKKRGSQC